MMSNKTYDILKWIALVALDALGLLYKTIAEIWCLPFGDEVLATCTAVSLCLGALIGVSGKRYADENTFVVDLEEGDDDE